MPTILTIPRKGLPYLQGVFNSECPVQRVVQSYQRHVGLSKSKLCTSTFQIALTIVDFKILKVMSSSSIYDKPYSSY